MIVVLQMGAIKMNRTKHEIIVAFWQLLEKKPYNKITVQDIVDHCHVNRNTFYYHFQDIPSLTEWSVETWSDEVIKNQVVFESLEHCILYVAEECMKRKKALLHLYRSSKKDYLLGYLNKVGDHVICTYIENRTGNMSLIENKAECLIRYYKCILIGIILDWMENDASYDLIEFCQESCELFSGSAEKALLKCIIPQDKC